MFINSVTQVYTLGSVFFIFILSIISQSKKNFDKRNGLFVKYRPRKKCFKCSGFGIVRCMLCKGKGLVLYERKYLRYDPCPKCLQKRFDICPFCKGIGERNIYGESVLKNYFSKIIRLFRILK